MTPAGVDEHRPVVAVAWRPTDLASGLIGLVLDLQLRRRLGDVRIVEWRPGVAADGLVGSDADVITAAGGASVVPLDASGSTPDGSLGALAADVDGDALDRRVALARRLGWFPPAKDPAVVVVTAPGVGAAVPAGRTPVSFGGADVTAIAPGGPYRLPERVLPLDVLGALGAAAHVITDQPAVASAARALGTDVTWAADVMEPTPDRPALVRRLDAFAGGVHLRALTRRDPAELGAELAAELALAGRRATVDRQLRGRVRAARDELADRVVAHELDLARAATADVRAEAAEARLEAATGPGASRLGRLVRRFGGAR